VPSKKNKKKVPWLILFGLLVMGGIMWAPMNLSMFWQSLLFSWIFGSYIKNRWPGWWAKYALVLSSALTAGIALSALVQFFAITNADVTVSYTF
jgi:hypothetical protein